MRTLASRSRLAAATAAVGLLALALSSSFVPGARAAPAMTGGGGQAGAPAGAAAAAADTDKDTPSNTATVRLVFKVVPPTLTTVTWGRKRLGIIKPKAPLILWRPRDSGPMDVVFKSQGYVTVHTRIYTFTNSVLAVKMTPVDKKNTLYGYREELPPDEGMGGAGGAGAAGASSGAGGAPGETTTPPGP